MFTYKSCYIYQHLDAISNIFRITDRWMHHMSPKRALLWGKSAKEHALLSDGTHACCWGECTALGGAYLDDMAPTRHAPLQHHGLVFPPSCHKFCNIAPCGSLLQPFETFESLPCRVGSFVASVIDDGHQVDFPSWTCYCCSIAHHRNPCIDIMNRRHRVGPTIEGHVTDAIGQIGLGKAFPFTVPYHHRTVRVPSCFFTTCAIKGGMRGR
jgi:hypothetical protein